jgi:tetratricopeptide (TPR) repeat protein
MKQFKINRVGLFLFLLAIIGCTTTIPMEVLRPADIVLDANIQKIALMDRSRPSSGFLNVLEGLVSGEGIGQDRQGREKAMQGLTAGLANTPRFEVVQTGISMEGTKGGQRMALPLDWAEVERICNSVGADALLVVESYDSDYYSSAVERERKKKDKEGNEIIELFWESRANLNIRIGWRIYDPAKRILIDEFTVDAGENYSGRGDTQEEAIARLPNPLYSSRNISLGVGGTYAERIAPVFILINRSLYNSGKKPFKEDMKQARDYIRVGNWDNAADLWSDVSNSAEPKTAAKACVNLAIAYERLGDFENAMKYVEKALFDYKFNGARTYYDQLNVRLREEDRASQQMENKRN